MKKIPIGISGIKPIINENYVYVDKTKEIKYLIDTYRYSFFSRPRRFGKSLTIDIVETLFTYGVDPYFKDSYIAGQNNDGTPRWNYSTYPVVRLDFSAFVSESISQFRELFLAQLNDYDEQFELNTTKFRINIGQTFSDFVLKLIKKYPAGFVLLIDEYDAPLNNLIDNEKLFESFRLEIRGLYSKIKESKISDNVIFMLVTGVTRFKDVSIFSAGSNIKDVSYDNNLSTLVGYTREEIEFYFKDYIDITIAKLHKCDISNIDPSTYKNYKESLLNTLALNYDNICYDEYGIKSVFSTWSINNFFIEASNKLKIKFGNYWFENGGTPTILIKYLQNHLVDFSIFNNKQIVISIEDFVYPASFKKMDINVLMAQTGYLSLTKGHDLENAAYLSIPNNELRSSLARLASTNIFGQFFTQLNGKLSEFLSKASGIELTEKFNEILAKIPRKDTVYNFEDEYSVKNIIQTFLLGANILCYREVFESAGRPDLIIELADKIIVVEFKFTKDSKLVQDKLEEAVNQILTRDYGQSFDCTKERLRIAVVYDANEKKLVAFKEC